MKRFDFKSVLGLLAIFGFFAVVFILIFSPGVQPTVEKILLILLGALVTLVKDVYGYYFGSSEGSAKKTELLSAAPAVAIDTSAAAPQAVTDDVVAAKGPGFGIQEPL
ncbi:MAG: hypothetical protein M0T70_02850 [Geobacteraceae bacterium]|nr:hypothetical protein [Geobacteraceae bacterium]